MTKLFFLIITIFSLSSFANGNDNRNAYYYSNSNLPSNNAWMNKINDQVKIRDMSIPGTHDSAALFGGDIAATQTLSITQQLNSGIRFLDIRLRHINDKFAIHHGIVYEKQMFGDILNKVRNFLMDNPSEFIFIRVKEEYSPVNNTRSFEDTFNSYVNMNSDIVWIPSSKGENPQLGDVRGKIVFLQNFAPSNYDWFGLDYYHTFNIQDIYHLTTNWDLYKKWSRVKRQLNVANKTKNSSINFLSGSGGSFPYFVASGHIFHNTSSPQLLTGFTTPIWKNIYPDFPRVHCFIGMCSIAFEGTNILTMKYINSHNNIDYVGIIAADFPGSGLINSIIDVNHRKEQ